MRTLFLTVAFLLLACAPEPEPKSCKPPLPPHPIVERPPPPPRHTHVVTLSDGTVVEEARQ